MFMAILFLTQSDDFAKAIAFASRPCGSIFRRVVFIARVI